MKKIIIWGAYPSVLKTARDGKSHLEGFGDNLLWWIVPLLQFLQEKGYIIFSGDDVNLPPFVDSEQNSTLLLLFDLPHPRDIIARRLYAEIPAARRILVRLEPPAVAPRAYTQNILSEFAALARVEVGAQDDLVPNVLDFKVPINIHFPSHDEPVIRSGLCAVTSHKRVTGQRGQMYRVRERVYRDLHISNLGFDLYGIGWDRFISGIELVDLVIRKLRLDLQFLAPKNVNYKGQVTDKSIITHYNYSIVIENFVGSCYYSEKPFDSLKYGVVPIYFGGVDFHSFGLENLVVQVRDARDFVNVAHNLSPPLPIWDVQQQFSRWLDSDKGKDFRIEKARIDILELVDRLAT